jgi:hypothetical protein
MSFFVGMEEKLLNKNSLKNSIKQSPFQKLEECENSLTINL